MRSVARARRWRFVAAVVGLAVVLSGCAGYSLPAYEKKVAELTAFAEQLPGVASVEAGDVRVTNMSDPFSAAASASVVIHLREGDDWVQTLRSVATATQEWLATKQTERGLTVGVSISFGSGSVGLGLAVEDTDARVSAVLALREIPGVVRTRIGLTDYDSVEPGGVTETSVSIGRDGASVASTAVRDVQSALAAISSDLVLVRLSGPFQADGSTISATEANSLDIFSDDFLAWADLIDTLPDVVGWRTGTASNEARDPLASVTLANAEAQPGVEAALRALPASAQLLQIEYFADGVSQVSTTRPTAAASAALVAVSNMLGVKGEVAVLNRLEATVSSYAAAREALDAITAERRAAGVELYVTIAGKPDEFGPANTIEIAGMSLSAARGYVDALLDLNGAAAFASATISPDSVYVSNREKVTKEHLRLIFQAIRAPAIEDGAQITVGSYSDGVDARFTAADQIGPVEAETRADGEAIAKLWNSLAG